MKKKVERGRREMSHESSRSATPQDMSNCEQSSVSESDTEQKPQERNSRKRSRSRSHHKRRKSKYRKKYSRSRSSSYSQSRSDCSSSPRIRGRVLHRGSTTYRRRYHSSRENPQPNRCLGVFGLSLSTTDQQLHKIFNKYGRVERVQLIIDAKTGSSRGFCFVYYENVEDARNAIEHCNGLEIGGRRIRVDFSITQRAHTPTPGVYLGKSTFDDRYRRRPYDDGHSHRRYYRSPSPQNFRSRRPRYARSRSYSYSPRRY